MEDKLIRILESYTYALPLVARPACTGKLWKIDPLIDCRAKLLLSVKYIELISSKYRALSPTGNLEEALRQGGGWFYASIPNPEARPTAKPTLKTYSKGAHGRLRL